MQDGVLHHRNTSIKPLVPASGHMTGITLGNVNRAKKTQNQEADGLLVPTMSQNDPRGFKLVGFFLSFWVRVDIYGCLNNTTRLRCACQAQDVREGKYFERGD